MVKLHLKRLNAPRTWGLNRKANTFITKPSPGPHSMQESMPLVSVLRDMLGICRNAKEVRYLLKNGEVMVDGKKRVELKYPVGLMDVLTINTLKKSYRVAFSSMGKIALREAPDAEKKYKIVKVKRKSTHKGKVLVTAHDGRNYLVEAKTPYAVGDSLRISLPDGKIEEHIKLEPGCTVYLIGGKHIGSTGMVENIEKEKLTFKTPEKSYQTLKAYALVIGKEKPLITLTA